LEQRSNLLKYNAYFITIKHKKNINNILQKIKSTNDRNHNNGPYFRSKETRPTQCHQNAVVWTWMSIHNEYFKKILTKFNEKK